MSDLAARIFEKAESYRDEAVALLRELIAIPGESNTEGPRLKHLAAAIEAMGAADRVFFDDFGNLVWTVGQGRPVVFLDGHTDTVGTGPMADWEKKGLHPYEGKLEDGWVWGRGSSDQLSGVVSQVFATRLLKELGLAEDFIVVSVGSVAEEANDGGGPRYIFREGIDKGFYPRPDVFLLTEGTGDATLGPLAIYRGHRGRMEIEVETFGRSCHGSNPDLGENAIVMMADIVKEVQALQSEKRLRDHEFLGRGSVTVSRIEDQSPSNNCVAPYCRIVLDRRMTIGEDRESCLAEIRELPSVRTLGDKVKVGVLRYTDATWKGYPVDDEIYLPTWLTEAEHPALQAAVATYRQVLSPRAGGAYEGVLFEEPRVARWIFSTDGVGVPNDIPKFGFSPGWEQFAHTLEERVDSREIVAAVAFMAYYPWLFAREFFRAQ
jgi:putative selenium metabolism hydrolase